VHDLIGELNFLQQLGLNVPLPLLEPVIDLDRQNKEQINARYVSRLEFD
jgi:hypothetical protein